MPADADRRGILRVLIAICSSLSCQVWRSPRPSVPKAPKEAFVNDG
jgi:hypothetical protein